MKQTQINENLAVGAACALALEHSFRAGIKHHHHDRRRRRRQRPRAPARARSTARARSRLTRRDRITSRFRTETSAEPVKYYYTKKTTVVDPEGTTVEWSMLKPGHAGDTTPT